MLNINKVAKSDPRVAQIQYMFNTHLNIYRSVCATLFFTTNSGLVTDKKRLDTMTCNLCLFNFLVLSIEK